MGVDTDEELDGKRGPVKQTGTKPKTSKVMSEGTTATKSVKASDSLLVDVNKSASKGINERSEFENTQDDRRNRSSPYNEILLIKIQSMLSQFSHPKVRADFLNGKFNVTINPNLLQSIDELRWTLFPRWRGGELLVHDTIMESAARHCCWLIERRDEVMHIGHSDTDTSLTYAQWFDTLDLIASDKYWAKVPTDERCTHILSSDVEVKEQKQQKTDKSKGKEYPSTSSGRIKIEEIVISSSSVDSSSSDNSVSAASDNELVPRYNLRKRKKDSREVVKPPVFEMNGKTDLRDSLKRFELYFAKQFYGDTYDQTQKLADHISGELLTVYNARGGRKLKYNEMKKELLDYYKKQKVGSKKYWRKQFYEARPEANENYDIYGMRLVELAGHAFPTDKKESAQQLREHYLKTLPSIITSKVKDAERSVRATGHKRKHLPFSTIMDIAKELQTSSENTKTVMWADNKDGSQGTRGQQKREWRRRRPSPAAGGAARDTSLNNKKGGQNASKSQCWRANNMCLICGKDHLMNDCPRYNPNYKKNERSPSNETVSVAKGNRRDD